MTLLVLQIVVFLAGSGVWAYLGHRLQSDIATRQEALDLLDEERRKALYKQQKQFHRTIAGTDRAIRKLADEVRSTRDDARLNLERADALYRDFKDQVR